MDHKYRILLAEDYPSNREFVTLLLRNEGFAVDAVPDGEAAWLLYQTHPTYHLVLTDQEMPNLEGTGLARKIAELDRRIGQETPIIIMSGLQSVQDDNSQVKAYLRKPFSTENLVATIHEILNPTPLAKRTQRS